MASSLDRFDPVVAAWFRTELGQPSDIQDLAWPAIANGEHVLVMAPTGSGKTLAALLWALNGLIIRTEAGKQAAQLTLLYLSPLKALNNDIRRNLIRPLNSLRSRFQAAERSFPDIRVAVRSGDTSQAERRAFLRRPADILATTPESLALILNSPKARTVLASVKLVVIDEIHALVATKRGALLAVNLERLGLLAGDFQRVALSATIADPSTAADFAAGFWPRAEGIERRPLTILRSSIEKSTDISICYVGSSDFGRTDKPQSPWPNLIDCFVEAAETNTTSLIFTNSRRNAEKTAFLMNEQAGREIAWAHHGSLSHEVRRAVEEQLKQGALPAVVATNSLELGIDIGSVDEVLLAGTPISVAASLQRAGRAGHRLGAVSRARLFPMHALDLLLATGLVQDARTGRLEVEKAPEAPLDLLAQTILAIVAMDDWPEAELFGFLKRTLPFRKLSQADYSATLALLRGRYANLRLAALRPRLDMEAPPGILRATAAVRPLLYQSGGVIPDRGYYRLELAGSRAVVGELDEEFVWERRVGDSFALGTRTWRIVSIDEKAVKVAPADGRIQIVPFWRAESRWRSQAALASVLTLLDGLPVNSSAKLETFQHYLQYNWALDTTAAAALGLFLLRQQQAAGLPGSRRVVLESFREPLGEGAYVFLHTLRGGRINAVLGIALRTAAEQHHIDPLPECYWDDFGVLMAFPALEHETIDPSLIVDLIDGLAAQGLTEALTQGLEASGLFGAMFRENAGRALLLPKAAFGKRTPLWITRQRAKSLYDAVHNLADFPIIKETWRCCLKDILDLDGASALLADLASGRCELQLTYSTTPSPFSSSSLWQASDNFIYQRDAGSPKSAAGEAIIRDFLDDQSSIIELEAELVWELVEKRRRTLAAYRVKNFSELVDWLDERQIMFADDWEALVASLLPSSRLSEVVDKTLAEPLSTTKLLERLNSALDRIRLPGAQLEFILSATNPPNPRNNPASLLNSLMVYEGLLTPDRLAAGFGTTAGDVADLAEAASLRLVRLAGKEPATEFWASDDFVAIALRKTRAVRRRHFGDQERPLEELQPWIAARQGLLMVSEQSDNQPEPESFAGTGWLSDSYQDQLAASLESLYGLPLAVDLWEREVLPARLAYRAGSLDWLLRYSELVWYGAGKGRVALAPQAELSEFLSCPNAFNLGPDRLESSVGDSSASTKATTKTDRRVTQPAAYSHPALIKQLLTTASHGASLSELAAACGLTETSTLALVRQLAAAGYLSTNSWTAARQLFDNRPTRARRCSAETKRLPTFSTSGRLIRPRVNRSASRPRAELSQRSSSRLAEAAHRPQDCWRSLAVPQLADNRASKPLEAEAHRRAALRRLLDRYGLACRSILNLEASGLSWSTGFRSLRLMEYAGEVVGGRFFRGLDEIQFMYTEEAEAWMAIPPTDNASSVLASNTKGFYCCCAADPASLCGFNPLASHLGLPARLASNHLVWRFSQPVLLARRNGRELEFRLPPDNPEIVLAIRLLIRQLRHRAVDPVATVVVETINGHSARLSAYADPLKHWRFVEAVRGLEYLPVNLKIS